MRCSVTSLAIIIILLWMIITFMFLFNYKNYIVHWIDKDIFSDSNGHLGEPVIIPLNTLSKRDQKTVENSWEKYGYNKYVSDHIGIRRMLTDPRPYFCEDIEVSGLPSASVIIVFHNEAWSVLLRTVHSVLDRTPPELLKDIILVDDFSTDEKLKVPLDDYFDEELKVKVLHLKSRHGLSRSRMFASKYAEGDVLTFLDSNCECSEGWLEPLLKEISINEKIIATPVLDIIDPETFAYKVTRDVFVGGFDWNLKFKWLALPETDETDRREAVVSPILPGGIFSISTSFFNTLGGFDEELIFMGGEIFEMSFKGWMCGGAVVVATCSHVGHIFRSTVPEELVPDRDYIRKNLIRVASAWMDDYAGYFFERIRLGTEKLPDVSKQIKLREDLNCHPFEWYLHNVYPDLWIPKDVLFRGQIANWDFNLCLSSLIIPYAHSNRVIPEVCKNKSERSFWIFSQEGNIRRDDYCLEYFQNTVSVKLCNGNLLQLWQYNATEETIAPKYESDKCLGIFHNDEKNEREVGVKLCDEKYFGIIWTFQTF